MPRAAAGRRRPRRQGGAARGRRRARGGGRRGGSGTRPGPPPPATSRPGGGRSRRRPRSRTSPRRRDRPARGRGAAGRREREQRLEAVAAVDGDAGAGERGAQRGVLGRMQLAEEQPVLRAQQRAGEERRARIGGRPLPGPDRGEGAAEGRRRVGGDAGDAGGGLAGLRRLGRGEVVAAAAGVGLGVGDAARLQRSAGRGARRARCACAGRPGRRRGRRAGRRAWPRHTTSGWGMPAFGPFAAPAGSEGNSVGVNNDLDGMERVWKAAGKRPYAIAGIEGFLL